MRGDFKLADFGHDEKLWKGSNGKPLFQKVEICWREPVPVNKDGTITVENEADVYKNGYLYAIVRNHGTQKTKDRIAYIGITNNLQKRFRNHPKVNKIRARRGETSISIGVISTPGSRLGPDQAKTLREELEHILIWVLYEDLWNDSKQLVVPGQGRNGGKAWDIVNEGFKFSGRMPKRIVFPWAAVIPRRNNTAK
jgi:GIY-YIG catalytic domain